MARKLTKKHKVVQKIVKKDRPVVAKAVAAASSEVSLPSGEYVEAVGRRKAATARVRLYKQSGDFIVNQMAAGQYFKAVPSPESKYLKPFTVTGTKGQFAVSAKVHGSGIAAQLVAVVHGLSRALVELNPEYRALLKPEGLLSRDDRMKETRKIGMGGKARRKRQSPKR